MPSPHSEARVVLLVGTLQALFKSFGILYFLLLPILFAMGILSAEQMGYVGALLVVGIIAGASIVTHVLHTRSKMALLYASLGVFFGATLLLFWPEKLLFLMTAYTAIGLATGVGMSTISALGAQLTTQGQRYKAFSQMAMMIDVIRIVYPLLASAIFVAVGFVGLVYFGLAVALLLFAALVFVKRALHVGDVQEAREGASNASLWGNKSFWYALWLEFLDSFASSQLFIFLPALLFLKNFSIEHALVMQSAVFLGYLAGRWLVGLLAHSIGGYNAVGVTELGMIATIVVLIIAPPSAWLYVTCFFLGFFARGTSSVIKAITLDRVDAANMRRGSAVYVTIGEIGSALAQLSFGFLLAWFGATAPFITAAVFAGIAALVCFSKRAS